MSSILVCLKYIWIVLVCLICFAELRGFVFFMLLGTGNGSTLARPPRLSYCGWEDLELFFSSTSSFLEWLRTGIRGERLSSDKVVMLILVAPIRREEGGGKSEGRTERGRAGLISHRGGGHKGLSNICAAVHSHPLSHSLMILTSSLVHHKSHFSESLVNLDWASWTSSPSAFFLTMSCLLTSSLSHLSYLFLSTLTSASLFFNAITTRKMSLVFLSKAPSSFKNWLSSSLRPGKAISTFLCSLCYLSNFFILAKFGF